MAENLWRRRPLTENPYDWTAFQVVGFSSDVVGRRAVNTRVTDVRKVVKRLPGQRQIAGKAVDPADITAAGQILADPNRRILEELLEHHPERLEVAELRRLQTIFAPSDSAAGSPLPVRHLHFLSLLIPTLLEAVVAGQPPVDLPPPPETLALVPPFGKGGP